MTPLIQHMKRAGYPPDEQVVVLIVALKEAVETLSQNKNVDIDLDELAEQTLGAISICSNAEIINALQEIHNCAIGWNAWDIADVEDRMECLGHTASSLTTEEKRSILYNSLPENSSYTFDDYCDIHIKAQFRKKALNEQRAIKSPLP